MLIISQNNQVKFYKLQSKSRLHQTVDKLEIRKSLINTLQGKYAHAPTSSEDFAQQKQKEIDWEDRNK